MLQYNKNVLNGELMPARSTTTICCRVLPSNYWQ